MVLCWFTSRGGCLFAVCMHTAKSAHVNRVWLLLTAPPAPKEICKADRSPFSCAFVCLCFVSSCDTFCFVFFSVDVLRANAPELKKAGNLRNAFERTSGDAIAIFDADFCPR